MLPSKLLVASDSLGIALGPLHILRCRPSAIVHAFPRLPTPSPRAMDGVRPGTLGHSCFAVAPNPLRATDSVRWASTKKGKGAKEEKKSTKKRRSDEEDEALDRDEDDGGRRKGKRGFTESDTAEEFDYESFVADDATKHLAKFQKDLAGLRSGAANPALLEKIAVKHKSSSMPLSQLAQITVKDQQTLIVIVNDESLIGPIEKSIRDDATLNLNPVVVSDSTGGPKVIKVPIPKPTDDIKQQMIKAAGTMAEKVKGSIRGTRQAARDALKKKYKDVYSSDDVHKIEKEIQTLVEKWSKEVDDVLRRKTKELGS
ncbi:ribosome recycling factor-domain-containing protein [Hyaloraphidium curvatum]|nr:ribosome recycling factor-domain-containing protein [Hyaloraphidium curvatum]